ncbi:MAG: hypothetical protein AAFZ18_26765 [Myxococcota bacterium]
MAAELRQARITVLSAPTSSGRPDWRVPPPSLDMIDCRELRVPRRRSVDGRRGDAELPRLHSEGLGLVTFAEPADEIGTVRSGPHFHLPPQALVDASSGQLAACLAARALAGSAPDAPLHGLWLATGAVADDADVGAAEVLPVTMVGYKAMLGALLLRRLHRDRPGSVAVEDGAPVAPFLVAEDQDLEAAAREVRRLADREGSEFWPYELESGRNEWVFVDGGGSIAARLALLPVATVTDGEAAMARWHEGRRPPPLVERERRRAVGAGPGAPAFLAALASVVLLAGGLFLWPQRLRPPLPAPTASPRFPIAPAASSPDESSPEPDRPGLPPGPPHIDTSAALAAESLAAPEPEPSPSVPSAPEKDETVAATPGEVPPPVVTPPEAKPSAARRLSPKAPKEISDRRAAPPHRRAPPPVQPPRPSPPPASEGQKNASSQDVRGITEEAPVANPTSVVRNEERVPEILVVTASGQPVSAALKAAIEARLKTCFRSDACRPVPDGPLLIEVRESLLDRSNPILEIGDERCTARRVASCFP